MNIPLNFKILITKFVIWYWRWGFSECMHEIFCFHAVLREMYVIAHDMNEINPNNYLMQIQFFFVRFVLFLFFFEWLQMLAVRTKKESNGDKKKKRNRVSFDDVSRDTHIHCIIKAWITTYATDPCNEYDSDNFLLLFLMLVMMKR